MKTISFSKLALVALPVLSIAASAAAQSTCASAIDLSGDSVPAALVVDNTGGAPGETVSCGIGDGNGPDAWVRLPDLVVGERYVVTTSAAEEDTVSDTRLAVLLGACGSATEIACSEDLGDNPYGAVEFEATQGGPYYALSETLAPDAVGTWLFTVQLASDAPAGFGCGSPTDYSENPLPLSIPVDLANGFDERGVSCAVGAGGAEGWFLLPPLPDGEVAIVSASPADGHELPAVRFEVLAGADCDMLASVACSPSGAPLGFVADGAARHLVFVEFADASQEGPFVLDVETIPAPAGPFCESPEDMTGSAFPILRIVDLDPTPSFAATTCVPDATGPERWFALPALDAGNRYTLSLADGPGAPDNAALALYRGTDCDALEPFACSAEGDAAGGPIAIEFVPKAGDAFFALVDAIDPEGELVTTLTLSDAGPAAPPENDLCEAAYSFTPFDLPFEHTVDVLGAGDSGDYAPDGSPSGVDVFYAFTVSGGTGHFRISASFEGTGDAVALAVWDGSDCGALVPLCGGPVAGGEPAIVAELVDRRLYYITLDDPDPSTPPSSYTLSVEALEEGAQSPNAECGDAANVAALPYEDTADPTWNPSTLELASMLGLPGCLGELHYVIQPAADTTLRVRVSAADGTGGVVGMYSDGCPLGDIHQGPWLNDALFDVTGGVPANIVVEPTHPDSGPLTVEVEEIARPANQTCDDPLWILVANFPYEETVEFLNARDEQTDGSCAANLRGGDRRDLFWRFAPPAAGNYRISAMPADPDNHPVDASIAVFSGACVELQEIVCRDFTLGGEQLTVELQAGLPYLVMVEVAEPDFVPESQPVLVSIQAAAPSSGHDECVDAQDIAAPFDGVVDTEGNDPLSFLFDGPVHIFRLVAPADGTFHIGADTDEAGLDLALAAIGDDCEAAHRRLFVGQLDDSVANESGPAQKGGGGATEALDVPVLAGESFLLHVFAVTPDGGPIDVSVVFEQQVVQGRDMWMLH